MIALLDIAVLIAVLAVTLRVGWWLARANRDLNRTVRDGLVCLEADRAADENDWPDSSVTEIREWTRQ